MTGARRDDRFRIRFEEEERSSEGRDLFLDFGLEAGMLDEVGDEVRELLGNEVWELLGNEARFCQARAALNPSLFISYCIRGRMPRNNKNSVTSNSNQFKLLVIEEDGTDDNAGGGTSAASATPGR
jgi:hypothetical protein